MQFSDWLEGALATASGEVAAFANYLLFLEHGVQRALPVIVILCAARSNYVLRATIIPRASA